MAKQPMKRKSTTPVLDNYDSIRGNYLQASQRQGPVGAPITDRHGFYVGNPSQSLGQRFSGLDKLFYTLVSGVVDDPDFAVQKDRKIYDKMMRDPQIFYCLAVRKAATSSLPWTIVPPEGYENDQQAKQIAQAAEKRLKRIPRFSELVDNTMDALLPGLAVNELTWKITPQGEYIVSQHDPVNKDRVKFTKSGNLRLLSPQNTLQGEQVPPYKFIVHRFNVTDGSWAQPENIGYRYFGRGLADTPLYHYFYFKMMALKFYMKTLERYGMPFKIFYTGAQNSALADKMSSIMQALQNDSVVGIPGKKGEVNVEIAKTVNVGQVFMLFINYVDSLITKCILGQELMTEISGQGSYAAAQVHRSTFGMLNARDRALLKDTFNRTLIKYDAQLNTPNLSEELFPVFDFKRSAVEDAAGFLGMVQTAQELGLTVSKNQVREYTGLKEPVEGEDIIEFPQQQIPEEAGSAGQTPQGNNSKTKDQNASVRVSKMQNNVSSPGKRPAKKGKVSRVQTRSTSNARA